MSGNYHVRFLGGKEAATPPTYPVAIVLFAVALLFGDGMWWGYYALPAICNNRIVKLKTTESSLVHYPDGTLGKLVMEIVPQVLIECRHGCFMHHHSCTAHTDLPGLRRVFESDKNFFPL